MNLENKIKKYLKKYSKSILVDKIFGNGEKLIFIGFNEHRRINLRYLIRIDSSVSVIDMTDLAEEIEDYLVEKYGMFDRHEDFDEWCEENNFDIKNCDSPCFCEMHMTIFDDWFIEQFPKVDISGGCSNWNEV